MEKFGDKLLNKVTAMADKVMKTSITKRGQTGMTTKIRFPLMAISNKLKSWLSIKPEVLGAITEIDDVIRQIPDPKTNGGMQIAVDSEIYQTVADLVTKFTTVEGVLGELDADAIKTQQANDMIDALNEVLEEQEEETVAMPVSSDDSKDIFSDVPEAPDPSLPPAPKPIEKTLGDLLAEPNPEPMQVLDEVVNEEEEYAEEEAMVAASDAGQIRRRRAMI